ncbi:hypothetical protein CSIM01_03569 [Colletotrichum simmondsii]|uniref:Uncharacterized protein n=1 Tax=Colletotrichum simmondsii TaxID=703756 RepID=A0A135RZ69_9PEZI|nr:hypothetical protein CSIM01_03569 [Colletotrichum simmondsii]
MVHITSAAVAFLAFFATTEACAGWYQCKYKDGSHCCVIDSGLGAGGCPSKCDGGSKWPAECISQTTGNSRTDWLFMAKVGGGLSASRGESYDVVSKVMKL